MLNPKRVLLCGAILLSSCASPGLQRITELVPGVSTQDDAIAKLGPPSVTSKIGDQTILQWTRVSSPQPIHLAILFGMDGRMIQAASDAKGLDQLSGVRR